MARIDPSLSREQFSHAHVHAVAAAAGFAFEQRDPDLDSVDATIRGRGARAALDVQMKCTTQAAHIRPAAIAYPLKKKNYDDLRETATLVPRVLIVVTAPRLLREWVRQTADELSLRYASYWMSLAGMPSTANTTRKTVKVPKSNQVTVRSLQTLMRRIEEGTFP